MCVYFILLLVLNVFRELLFSCRMIHIAFGSVKMKCEFRVVVWPRIIQSFTKLFEIALSSIVRVEYLLSRIIIRNR